MKTIQLDYPIMIDGQKITRIDMRRPKVRDRLLSEKLDGSDAEKEVRLLANLCEFPPQQLEELDMADYVKLQEALADFLS